MYGLKRSVAGAMQGERPTALSKMYGLGGWIFHAKIECLRFIQ